MEIDRLVQLYSHIVFLYSHIVLLYSHMVFRLSHILFRRFRLHYRSAQPDNGYLLASMPKKLTSTPGFG